MPDRISIRALLIDDDEAILRRLGQWLEDERIDAAAFAEPEHALAHANQRHVDVALIDLRLPEIDGVDVIARMHSQQPNAPILAMAAFADADLARRALDAGANELLEKPLDRQATLSAIDRQLAAIGIPVRWEALFNQRLGLSLRRARLEAGIKQADLAHHAGISPAQLSQIELGRTATSTWTLARICGAMHVGLADVLRRI